MPVQHYLGGEWRMPADLDSDVAPVGIHNMKRVMIYVRHRCLPLEVMIGADIPYRGPRATHQNQEQPSGDLRLGQILFRDIVFPLPNRTVDDRDAWALA